MCHPRRVYRELAVAPELAGVVDAVWVRDPPSGHPAAVHRILPDGCTDLIWAAGGLLVAGPDTRAHLTTIAPGTPYAAVRFAPGAGPAVLGVPGQELRDQRVPLDALWPAGQVRRLAGQLSGAADRAAAIQAVVRDRLAVTGPPDPVVAAVASQQWAGDLVAATAAALGLSERQLHRRCLAAFGYGPKLLARILRFRRAAGLARAGVRFAEVAVAAGYADQAHLAREVRALSGVPLRVLTGADAAG
ncbi:MAG: helix-turn-helix domain-containing protein [Micromonosporaceae bacterium]|nr:helix-turn-helix domain-containing protein [Micromonosporaceae bacterium]